eukprot:gene6922-biopygen15003
MTKNDDRHITGGHGHHGQSTRAIRGHLQQPLQAVVIAGRSTRSATKAASYEHWRTRPGHVRDASVSSNSIVWDASGTRPQPFLPTGGARAEGGAVKVSDTGGTLCYCCVPLPVFRHHYRYSDYRRLPLPPGTLITVALGGCHNCAALGRAYAQIGPRARARVRARAHVRARARMCARTRVRPSRPPLGAADAPRQPAAVMSKKWGCAPRTARRWCRV